MAGLSCRPFLTIQACPGPANQTARAIHGITFADDATRFLCIGSRHQRWQRQIDVADFPTKVKHEKENFPFEIKSTTRLGANFAPKYPKGVQLLWELKPLRKVAKSKFRGELLLPSQTRHLCILSGQY